jgi:outer membrane protein assembly factor BamB
MSSNRRRARAMLSAAATAALALAPFIPRSAAAQEATTWSQYQGDAAHTAFVQDGPEPPFRVRWTLPAPAGVALSAAVVEGDEAITVGEEAVYGIDVGTGDVAWQIPRAGGPLSVPAVGEAAGRRAVVYAEGPPPTVSAPGSAAPSASASRTSETTSESASETSSPSATSSPAASGTEEVSSVVAAGLGEKHDVVWRTPLQDVSRSGITIDGGAAYVGDQSGNVYALSLDDGSIMWTAKVGGRADTSIAVGDGTVFVVGRDSNTPRVVLAAFDAATGERAWSPLALQVNSTAGSAPTFGGGSLFVGSADRRVRALDASNGIERWNALVLSVFSPATALAFDGPSVFAADITGGLYRLDASDGSRLWTFHMNEGVLRGAPVVSGSSVLLGLGEGGMAAVDVDSGHLVWRSTGTPGLVGSIAVAGDAVIAVKGGRDAGLVAFEHDPDETLLDEPSPTDFDPGTSLTRWAIAAVVVFAIAFIPGTLARRRFGMADDVSDEATADAEDAFDEDEDEVEDDDDPERQDR